MTHGQIRKGEDEVREFIFFAILLAILPWWAAALGVQVAVSAQAVSLLVSGLVMMVIVLSLFVSSVRGYRHAR